MFIMSRVVALQEGLEDIGEYLRHKGFKVVPWGDNRNVDAVVYHSRKFDEIDVPQYPPEMQSLSDDTTAGSYGVLLVNAQNKTPQEVYEIIKNRVYEHFI